MTCDNNRPCERCVARGLADTCRDGLRKKAKYLSDVPEALANSDESLKFDPRYNSSTGAKRKTAASSSSGDKSSAKSRKLSQLPANKTSTPITGSTPVSGTTTPSQRRISTPLQIAQKSSTSSDSSATATPAPQPFNDISLTSLKPISFTEPKLSQQNGDDSQNSTTTAVSNTTHTAQSRGLSINTASTSPFNSLLAPLTDSVSSHTTSTQLPNLTNGSKNITDGNNSQSALPPQLLSSASANNTSSLAIPTNTGSAADSAENISITDVAGATGTNIPANSNSTVNLNDPNTWLYNLRPSRHNFQSMAVNMEYSIISNIINNTPHNNGLAPTDLSGAPVSAATAAGAASAYSPSLSSAGGDSPSLGKYSGEVYGTPTNPGSSSSHYHGGMDHRAGSSNNHYNPQTSGVFHLNNLNQYALGLVYSVPSSISNAQPGSSSTPHFGSDPVNPSETVQNLPEILDLIDKLKQAKQEKKNSQQHSSFWAEHDSPQGPKRFVSFTISTKPITPYNTPVAISDMNTPPRNSSNNHAGSPSYNNNDNSAASYMANGGISASDEGMLFRKYSEPADIYANVRQPYSYTPAYHQLTIYIRTRFTREQQLRIAKCMASYRPSFIACTNTLKEDDLIFMEQCFQRTLLEYEKFISYSGTPTVVWRRTGQVAAVGKEFCILTGWPRERLLNDHTFIVELMDDHSVLEYFEMFSKMAFGDSRGATMTECTLLTPQGQKIKTSSIWTLKRDVFGIPMMIVGNFLPILN